jgi:hypothetical protein
MVPSATTSNRRGIRWQTHLGNEKGQSPVPQRNSKVVPYVPPSRLSSLVFSAPAPMGLALSSHHRRRIPS